MKTIINIIWNLVGVSVILVIFQVEPEDYSTGNNDKKSPKSRSNVNNAQNTLKKVAWILSLSFLIITLVSDMDVSGG
jgi:preprotein translocase subunit SecG